MEAAALPVRRARRSSAAAAIRKFIGRYGLIVLLLLLPVYFGVQDIVQGHSLTHSVGSATFVNKNVGTGKTVTASGLTLSGAAAGNYQLSTTSATTTANIS